MIEPTAATSRRSLVWSALASSLDNLCTTIRASGALILLQAEDDATWEVTGTSSSFNDRFQPNEPVRIRRSSVDDATSVVSLLRASRLTLGTAVSCLFNDRGGRGILLVAGPGDQHEPDPTGVIIDLQEWRERVSKIRHSDLDGAYKTIAEAATSELSTDRLMDVVLAGARQLLETDVAYLAMPVDDEIFAMSRTLGIRTQPFQRLRVAPDQGLGGAVRHEGTALRTLDYQLDSRLGPALRHVTMQEGIVSAVATPVFDHNDIGALLYVGNRDLTAFSSQDQQLLAEFSEATRLALRHESLEIHRRHLVRREERSRLARVLHDKLGRQLTQMAAATAAMQTDQESAAFMHHLDAMNLCIEACSGLLRDEMDNLLGVSEGTAHEPLELVADSILAVPSVTGMERVISYTSADGSAAGARLVTADVAEAIIQVGQEALFNAEHHSQGQTCRIEFVVHDANVTVNVCDDGVGTKPNPTPGHHGLRLMQESAARVDGDVTVTSSPEGGVKVSGVFPLTPFGS